MQYNIITSALFCLVEKPVEEITFENYEIPQEFRSQLKRFYKGIFKLENFGSKYPLLFVCDMGNDSEVSNITYMFFLCFKSWTNTICWLHQQAIALKPYKPYNV